MQSVPRISLPELILGGVQTTSIFGSLGQGHFSAFIYVVQNELRDNATTVKPALGGYLWHLRWCLLNRGVCLIQVRVT